MSIIITLILGALGLVLAFYVFVWSMVILRILFQLFALPIIAALLTWWIWDNAWIGGIIGSIIVIFISINNGGIGWIFDNDGSDSSSSYSRRPSFSSSSSSTSYNSDNKQISSAAQACLNRAEEYKRQYETYFQKAEEALKYAETNEYYANDEANKASLYNDPSYLDKAREYRSWANQYANEAKSYFDKAENARRNAENEFNSAQAYSRS